MANAADFFDALNAWGASAAPPDGTDIDTCPRFDPAHFKALDPGPTTPYEADTYQERIATPGARPMVNTAGQATAAALHGPIADNLLPTLP